MRSKLITYACPTRLNKKGEVEHVGCGGNWAPALPERCPTCKGPVLKLQETTVVDLK